MESFGKPSPIGGKGDAFYVRAMPVSHFGVHSNETVTVHLVLLPESVSMFDLCVVTSPNMNELISLRVLSRRHCVHRLVPPVDSNALDNTPLTLHPTYRLLLAVLDLKPQCH